MDEDAAIAVLNKPLTEWTVCEKLAFASTYNLLHSDKIGHAEGARTLETYYRKEYTNKIDRLDTEYNRLKEVADRLLAYLLDAVKAAAPIAVAVPVPPRARRATSEID